MAFSLVQQSAAVVEGIGDPIVLTLPAGSTAGNLLVAGIGGNNIGDVFTFPTSWVRVATITTTATVAELWHYVNNPGGISSVSVSHTATNSFHGGAILEVSGAASVPLDRTGTATGTTGTTHTVTTSATLTAANELGVAMYALNYGSSTKVTYTPGSGWLSVANDGGTKQSAHVVMDYLLDAGASGSTLSEALGDSIGTSVWAAVIATWKTTAAAAQIWQPLRRNVNQAVQQSATW